MRPNGESTLMLPHEYRTMFELEDRYWWYRALRSWVKASLLSRVEPGATVLDAGCGTGATLTLLETLGCKPFAIDASRDGIRLAAASRENCRSARGVSIAS